MSNFWLKNKERNEFTSNTSNNTSNNTAPNKVVIKLTKLKNKNCYAKVSRGYKTISNKKYKV